MDLTRPDMVLRYKADASRNGLLVMAATAPVWAIWMPWVMTWLLTSLIQDLTTGSITWDMFALFLFFLMIVLSAISTVVVCLDNRLIISEKGVKVPVRFMLQTLGRVHFKWDNLQHIVFRRNGKPSPDADEICFDFDKLSRAPLRLDGFQREDIPQILLAVQAYAPKTEIVPNASDVKGIPMTATSAPLSFTRLWEEELNNRFGSTIFVPLEPGQQLQNGRIKIVGQIAFGGLSAIYLSKLDNDQLVVVKEAVVPQNADEASKEKALEMFNREAKFLCTLNHPRIANVFDHFVEGGRNYLLLQYIEGKDLRTYVKEHGPVPEQIVIRWAREIAEILVYLHGLDPPIIHRDLTPDNLVLARDGSICMIDFGAANNFMGTATGTLVGKQSYISPEQFRGKAVPESDLYSLGCTLHFLLTGKDPEPLSVSHPKELNNNISGDIDALIASLTEQEVPDRAKPSNSVLSIIDKLSGTVMQRHFESVGHHG